MKGRERKMKEGDERLSKEMKLHKELEKWHKRKKEFKENPRYRFL